MPAARVTKNGTLLAESNETIIVEGNHYFPPSSIVKAHFKPSTRDTHTYCPWKGQASYYDITLPGSTEVSDGAWFYPQTYDKAQNIKDYVAFYKNKVDIEAI